MEEKENAASETPNTDKIKERKAKVAETIASAQKLPEAPKLPSEKIAEETPTGDEQPVAAKTQKGAPKIPKLKTPKAPKIPKVDDSPKEGTSSKVVFEEAGDFKPARTIPAGMVAVPGAVFPSEEETVLVEQDGEYGGAHRYHIKHCKGFNGGKTEYTGNESVIQFIQKNQDGSIIEGIQSEQLILMLIDRHKKLNRKFPSESYYKLLQGLNYVLEASRERVQERIARGVMGELKK